uniref:Myb domain protein 62 n=1 Tax=Tanacetum cinerariifolium TaxID=118510 RepID=A0A699HBC1_TANCI|nr:myb domain protein 62 [Tanacetum cinerariifolium]
MNHDDNTHHQSPHTPVFHHSTQLDLSIEKSRAMLNEYCNKQLTEKSGHRNIKQKLGESKAKADGDCGLSKVNEHTVVSGGVRGALPSMAPEPFRGKSRFITDKSSDASMKHKGLDKMDYSRSGPGKRVLKRSRGGSKKKRRNEYLEDHLEVNSPRTDIHINGPQSEEHIGSTSNGTTIMRKETRALSATKRNRLNNRKLVFDVDDCAGRIVGEDSQTFITKGGCLVRESAKFDGTTWRKQQPLLKTYIISKCTDGYVLCKLS